MGAGATAGIVAATQAASVDELSAALKGLSDADRTRLVSALGATKKVPGAPVKVKVSHCHS